MRAFSVGRFISFFFHAAAEHFISYMVAYFDDVRSMIVPPVLEMFFPDLVSSPTQFVHSRLLKLVDKD